MFRRLRGVEIEISAIRVLIAKTVATVIRRLSMLGPDKQSTEHTCQSNLLRTSFYRSTGAVSNVVEQNESVPKSNWPADRHRLAVASLGPWERVLASVTFFQSCSAHLDLSLPQALQSVSFLHLIIQLLLVLMPKSEIDDIFAAKGKIPVPGPSSSKIPSTKKKSKKRPREHLETTDNNSSPPVVIPETIVDSSALVPPPAKRPKQGKKEKSSQPAAPDSFADSRGSGSRTFTLLFSCLFSLTYLKDGKLKKDGQSTKKMNLA